MYGAYEDVLPGSADRILSMAESEQRHRIEWETDALHASMRDTKSGQRFGFAALTVCIGAAVFLAMHGHDTVAGIMAGVSVVGLVGRFLAK